MADPFWRDVPGDPLVDAFGSPILDPITGLPVLGPPIPAPPVVDREAVRPSVDDIARLSRTRTIGPGGDDRPSFDEQTRPTADEVEDLIDGALEDTLGQLPTNIDPVWNNAIKRVIAIRAAAEIEVSFFRESASGSNAVAGAWSARFLVDPSVLQGLIPRAVYLS